MKVLILGSSGQIGSALFNYMNPDAMPFDILLDPTNHDLRRSVGDNDLISMVNDSDFVYFLAFDVGGSIYLKKYEQTYDFIDNNARIMVNTFKTLEWAKKPFIFASSQMSNMSYSPYGVLKALGEYYTKSLGGLVVKFWNVYGVENDLEKTHVITDLVLKGLKNGRIDVNSSGMEQRQFLHVQDCCKALGILAEQYEQLDKDKPYHITNFKWNSIRDVASIISQKLGGLPISYAKEGDLVQKDARNEPDPYILNLWKPEVDLEEGIGKIVDHYGKHLRPTN